MNRLIQLFLIFEGAGFAIAGSIHGGLLVRGYEHRAASIAETTIAVVLLIGLGLTWIWPARTRLIGFAVQAFAFLGTLVGLFTIAVGVGPRTLPDLAFHFVVLVALACGLAVASRSPAGEPGQPSDPGRR